MFCSVEEGDYEELARILKVYERASSQRINMYKSSIFFSPNIDEAKRSRLMIHLGISKIMKGEKYLVLPMILGISKIYFFRD